MENKMAWTPRITSAEFGDWHYGQLLDWAFTDKKQSKGTLLRDIGAARVEDSNNQVLLKGKLEEYVRLYRLGSVQELQDRIREADRGGITIRELHRRLAQAAGVEIQEPAGEE